MITIGRQTDYAARIVLHLASAEGEGMVKYYLEAAPSLVSSSASILMPTTP